MGKDKNRAPYFRVPKPFSPEDEKEADPYDGKPPSVKLLLDDKGKAIYNPQIQVQPCLRDINKKPMIRFQCLMVNFLP
jgi:hypothetical protein